MTERRKLELQLNSPTEIELLFEEPILGKSQYGEYAMYGIKTKEGEMVYFAPTEVDEKLRSLRKGDRFEITKIAKQNGSKINISYDVKVIKDETSSRLVSTDQPENSKTIVEGAIEQKNDDNFFHLMLQSCREAQKIQNELGGMMDAKSLAVSLFIARSSRR